MTLFREQLQHLANRLQRTIRVSHIPPYCSKYNPIDHRVFCHIARSLQSLLLTSVEVIRDAIARTTTRTRLRVISELSRIVYPTKEKAPPQYIANPSIIRDEFLGQFNYLFDVSSSYYTGRKSSLVRHGYSRGHRGDQPQIVYGLLCDSQGRPIAVEVFPGNTADFPGNTADPVTFAQILIVPFRTSSPTLGYGDCQSSKSSQPRQGVSSCNKPTSPWIYLKLSRFGKSP